MSFEKEKVEICYQTYRVERENSEQADINHVQK